MSAPTGNYFAALPARIPVEVLDAVRENAPPGLRWLHPDDLHLTLAFLGREDQERLAILHDLLEQIPFTDQEISLGSLLALPKPNRITALSFELKQGHDELADLIATWRGPLLDAAGRDPDDRPPRPHLTIARPPRGRTRAGNAKLLKWAETLPAPARPVRILRPALYGWSPDRRHRQFRIIEPR